MIDIVVSDVFAERAVPVWLGCLRARVTVGDDADGLGEALEAETEACKARLEATPIAELPMVAATRKAYRALGKDPARYRPAAEALMRRIKSGKGLWRVNTAVDVNNLVSIQSGISIGAYDLSKVAPPVDLRRAGEGDSHEGIGRGPLNLEGLPILADAMGPFGCPTSDSERTKITLQTTDLLMVLFGFSGDAGAIEDGLALTAACLERWCGAREVETWVVAGGAGM